MFDYNALTLNERDYLQQKTGQIKSLMMKALETAWEAGRELAAVRDLLRHNKAGGFKAWAEQELGSGIRTAYNCISVYERFPNCANFAQFQPSALYLLASESAPEEARGEAIALAESGEYVTYTAAKSLVAKHREVSVEVGQQVYVGEPANSGEVVSLENDGTAAMVRFDGGARACIPVENLQPQQVPEAPPPPPVQDRDLVGSVQSAVQKFKSNQESAKMPRVANDYYPTQEPLTRALIERFNFELDSVILEPCAGHGHIANLLDEYWETIANEPYPCDDFAPDYQMDATDPAFWEKVNHNEGGFDWVVTNPPYESGVVLPILKLSLQHARRGLAALLRLNYLEPCQDRREWLAENADHLRLWLPVSPRPQFRQDTASSDNITVAWCVWDKQWSWKDLQIDCPFQFVWDWR